MNTLIINKLYGFFTTTNELDDLEKVKLQYMLTIVVNEILKLVAMLIFFGSIDKLFNFLICFITLTLIRSFSGGLHIKSFFGCLFFTCSFFLASIYIPVLIPINYMGYIILYIFSLTTMALIAPKPSKQRGEYSSYQKQKFKLKSMITVTFCFLILLFKMNNPYLINNIWVIVFQSIQLLLSEGRDRYENIKKTI
jgi:accessory gene regulator B